MVGNVAAAEAAKGADGADGAEGWSAGARCRCRLVPGKTCLADQMARYTLCVYLPGAVEIMHILVA